jgi:hypothetical protein
MIRWEVSWWERRGSEISTPLTGVSVSVRRSYRRDDWHRACVNISGHLALRDDPGILMVTVNLRRKQMGPS